MESVIGDVKWFEDINFINIDVVEKGYQHLLGHKNRDFR